MILTTAANFVPLKPLRSNSSSKSSRRAAGVKDSYWRWPQRNLAGNAIDFHVQVLGLSFHDAMRQITGT